MKELLSLECVLFGFLLLVGTGLVINWLMEITEGSSNYVTDVDRKLEALKALYKIEQAGIERERNWFFNTLSNQERLNYIEAFEEPSWFTDEDASRLNNRSLE